MHVPTAIPYLVCLMLVQHLARSRMLHLNYLPMPLIDDVISHIDHASLHILTGILYLNLFECTLKQNVHFKALQCTLYDIVTVTCKSVCLNQIHW